MICYLYLNDEIDFSNAASYSTSVVAKRLPYLCRTFKEKPKILLCAWLTC